MNDRDLRKIAEGREAEIFEWEDGKVLRLMRDSEAREPVEMFAAATQAAHDAGVSVPVPYEVVTVDGRPGLVMEAVAGPDLLMLIARQYRLLLLAKGMLEQGIRAPEISARLHVQGFVIQRLLKQAPRYTIERLRQAYRRLLAADLAVKRGVFDDETALQLLLAELAAFAQPAGRGAAQRQPAMAGK